MSIDDMAVQAKIEAALYVSGRPLTEEELAKAGGITSKRKAAMLTRRLAHMVNSTLKAVEVVELPENRFAMQLRPAYARVARRFATEPLLPPSMLKTLSYIVYFQPISGLDLAAKRGSQVYQHLKRLEQVDFIAGEASGRTKLYRTTSHFSEYFGLSSDPQTMKKQLSRLGLQRPRS